MALLNGIQIEIIIDFFFEMGIIIELASRCRCTSVPSSQSLIEPCTCGSGQPKEYDQFRASYQCFPWKKMEADISGTLPMGSSLPSCRQRRPRRSCLLLPMAPPMPACSGKSSAAHCLLAPRTPFHQVLPIPFPFLTPTAAFYTRFV